MLFRINRDKLGTAAAGPTISVMCPLCSHYGTFIPMGGDIYEGDVKAWFGQRRCPNLSCNGHVFFVGLSTGHVITYPGATIPFDTTGIPKTITSACEEAIKCYSNQCYVASAIMIRKTLELLCVEQNVTGNNLYQKLTSLSAQITIPQKLKEAMHDLRLLGNDAAHVESQTYHQIGKEEIEISMLFTKEILKAVYQYDDLLQKLQTLKKNTP